MAQTSTVHSIELELADVDRAAYATLAFKAARHPSETADFFATRLLAFALEYAEGIAFSKGGISDLDEPAIVVRDLTGALTAWIEIGTPDANRLHKAAKAVRRVAVYPHKDPGPFLASLADARIHRADEIELVTIDRPLVEGLAARLDRRMSVTLSVTEGQAYLTVNGAHLEGAVTRRPLVAL